MSLSLPRYIHISIPFGGGDDMGGSPHQARIARFLFFELILFLKLDKKFSVEQLETSSSPFG